MSSKKNDKKKPSNSYIGGGNKKSGFNQAAKQNIKNYKSQNRGR